MPFLNLTNEAKYLAFNTSYKVLYKCLKDIHKGSIYKDEIAPHPESSPDPLSQWHLATTCDIVMKHNLIICLFNV